MLCSSLLIGLTDVLCQIAQAGGGGNFGGGGGGGGGGFSGGGGGFGGGSGGGGGSGDGEAIAWLISFTIHHPQYGIPLCLAIAYVLYSGHKTTNDHRITRTIRKGRKFQEDDLRTSALATIQQRDHQFDQQIFLERVERAFLVTQNAWSEQDLRSCRPFLSDGVHERFDLYIRMQQAENIRNRMKNVQVVGKSIVSITTDRHFDTIHVQITASAISYNEDLTTQRHVGDSSSKSQITFTEVWSFSRRPGVATNPQSSVLEGRCPNCGSPVGIVDKAKCDSCGTMVNAGQHDWVLSEITQDEEWVVPPAQHSVAKWNQLQKKDPGLNFQHLEDRASVIFWRCLMAEYFDDFSYAAPIQQASDAQVPMRFRRGQNAFWKTPAVGVVEVVSCVPAAKDEFDRVMVLVRWSATKASGDHKKPKLLGHQRIYSHVLVLKRKSGVSSKAELAFSSFSCTGCGAPLALGKADQCDFCGAAINDGSGDWVLEDVLEHDMIADLLREDRMDHFIQSRGGVERLETDRFLNEPELLMALSKMVTIDGELHRKEKDLILKLAGRRGVSSNRLKTIFDTAIAGDIPITLPKDRSQSAVFMDHLLRAALVDGQVTRKEKALLTQASAELGWAPIDLKMALSRVRGELHKQAKSVIREQRRR